MNVTGEAIVQLARKHMGEKYVLGVVAPKNNPAWQGPWDCAEFTSWHVFQIAATLYGCSKNSGDPAKADAWTGFWKRDANSLGKKISLEQAARTPGAMVLRVPAPGAIGHICISDGAGGTVEAHSTARGVVADTLANRRWDMGILVPGIAYTEKAPIVVPKPKVIVFRLKKPPMTGAKVKEIQSALKATGFHPGPVDGEFGSLTHAAVVAFQAARGLIADGEAGPRTAKALGVILPAV